MLGCLSCGGEEEPAGAATAELTLPSGLTVAESAAVTTRLDEMRTSLAETPSPRGRSRARGAAFVDVANILVASRGRAAGALVTDMRERMLEAPAARADVAAARRELAEAGLGYSPTPADLAIANEYLRSTGASR